MLKCEGILASFRGFEEILLSFWGATRTLSFLKQRVSLSVLRLRFISVVGVMRSQMVGDGMVLRLKEQII